MGINEFNAGMGAAQTAMHVRKANKLAKEREAADARRHAELMEVLAGAAPQATAQGSHLLSIIAQQNERIIEVLDAVAVAVDNLSTGVQTQGAESLQWHSHLDQLLRGVLPIATHREPMGGGVSPSTAP